MSSVFQSVFQLLVLLLLPWNAFAFDPVTPGRTFSFPRDHGAHEEFETEWWYFTGHLQTSDHRTFGFQITFFRVGVEPNVQSLSAWHVRSIHLAHFALTDDHAQKFHHYERFSRGTFAEAGAEISTMNVWNGDWRATLDGERYLLTAAQDGVTLSLALTPSKPIVLQGDKGFSRKGDQPADASYYYSLTRLLGNGTLSVDGETLPVATATAWLDREFTSSKLAQATLGWDWFALQLSSGEELMVYQLRNADGSPSVHSQGTLIRRDGSSEHLQSGDFSIEVLSHWQSKKTGIRYPASWKISLLKQSGYEFVLRPTVADQELVTEASTGVSYWEGRAKVVSPSSQALGNAYVELVGYETEQGLKKPEPPPKRPR